MKALVAGLVLLAAGAEAACVEGPITSLQTGTGMWVSVVSQKGDRTTVDAGGSFGTMRQTTWQGVIPLLYDMPEGKLRYSWTGSLPDLTAAAAGQGFVLKGTSKGPDGVTADVVLEIEVLGPAKDRIGGCSYPVTRIRTREWNDGIPVTEAVHDLHVPSMLVLDMTYTDLKTGETVTDAVERAD